MRAITRSFSRTLTNVSSLQSLMSRISRWLVPRTSRGRPGRQGADLAGHERAICADNPPLLRPADPARRRLCGATRAFARCTDDHASSASAVTRDYVLDLDAAGGGAPMLSVFGGKITTYRKLAEHALAKLEAFPGGKSAWTAGADLPGGDVPGDDFEALLARMTSMHPALPVPLLRRLARAYGTRAARIRRRCTDARRAWHRFWRGPYASRSRLSVRAGMGPFGRRHPLPPQQTRPACAARHGGPA